MHIDKQRVRERIVEIGIVPVVRAASPREARMAADAVCEGGIPIVEITMTVPGAVDVIRELTKSGSSDVLVGAGTVLDRKSTRLNSSHSQISYAVFCLKKKLPAVRHSPNYSTSRARPGLARIQPDVRLGRHSA